MADTIKGPFEMANTILKETGTKLSQLRPGDYDRMIKAIESGDFDIGVKPAADGKVDIMIGGIAGTQQTADNGCPSWMPEALCGGYAKIQKYGQYGTGPLAAIGAIADIPKLAEDEFTAPMVSYAVRIGMFLLGIVLLALGIVFLFKDSAIEMAVPLAKTLKKAS